MTDITLSPITSGYNLSKLNANFEVIEEAINNDVLNLSGGNNTMLQDLDMNDYALLNVKTDPNNPNSLLTVSEGDLRYYNVSGDMLTGPMDVNNQVINNLKPATLPHQPIRKDALDYETNARAAADANLQEQLNGTNPPMGSAFSEISWHGKVIENSIVLPNDKNAWSFGPTMTIATGQFVTIPEDTYWTIANGATTGDGTLTAEVPDPLDFGEL